MSLDTAAMVCPGNKLKWDLTESEIYKRTEALITSAKAVYDAVGSLTADEASYQNVIEVCAFIDFVSISKSEF